MSEFGKPLRFTAKKFAGEHLIPQTEKRHPVKSISVVGL